MHTTAASKRPIVQGFVSLHIIAAWSTFPNSIVRHVVSSAESLKRISVSFGSQHLNEGWGDRNFHLQVFLGQQRNKSLSSLLRSAVCHHGEGHLAVNWSIAKQQSSHADLPHVYCVVLFSQNANEADWFSFESMSSRQICLCFSWLSLRIRFDSWNALALLDCILTCIG